MLVNLGTACQCFLSTSILSGIRRQYPGAEIGVICKEENKQIFSNNNFISVVISDSSLNIFSKKIEVDLVINLSNSFIPEGILSAKQMVGIKDENQKQYKILFENLNTDKNILQIYFSLIKVQWRGQGFNFTYYPKNRQKDKTGILLNNINLKNHLIENLKINENDIKLLSFRKDIYKKFDEINNCKKIITDDFFSYNIALHLRKQVVFLKTQKYNFKIKPFGKVQQIDVSKHFLTIF